MNEKTTSPPRPDAAFHDIGKIVNWYAVGLRAEGESDPHEFEKCINKELDTSEWGIDVSATPWQSILTWSNKWPQQYPGSLHRWHVKTADFLASGYSRSLTEQDRRKLKGAPRYGVYKLWTGEQTQDLRLNTKEQLEELIRFLNTSPTWEETVERYRDQLCARPEEARPGFNITSLETHSAIVQRLARILAKAEWRGVDPSSGVKMGTVKSLQYPPPLILCRFQLDLKQRPFRARDLGVFAYMEKEFKNVAASFSDNILTMFAFECIAAFESEESKMAFVRELEEAGFVVTAQSVNKTVAEYLGSNRGLMEVLDAPAQHVYEKEPPSRIELPICEGCQMAQATKHWPRDYMAQMPGWSSDTKRILSSTPWRSINLDQIPQVDRDNLASWLEEWGEEDLCDQCFRIRHSTHPIELLKIWEGDVVYVRTSLDIQNLASSSSNNTSKGKKSCLQYLHEQYLRSIHGEIDEELISQLPVVFPVVADFVRDYKDFIEETWHTLKDAYDRRAEKLSTELICVGIEKRSEVFDILDRLVDLFHRAFPKIIEFHKECVNPIGISLSISKKKHPFFDHWRFLQAPHSGASIQVVGSGVAQFEIADYPRIAGAIRGAKRSQLHRLAAAAGVSRALGELVLRERDRSGVMLAELGRLMPSCLDFESARILANLMEG